MIEPLLGDRLETVTANVYATVAPTNYLTPGVVYQRLQTEAIGDLDGLAEEAFITFQLSISSPVFGEAKLLARAIRNNLRDWQDDTVQAVSWIDEIAAVDNSTETPLHRVLLFFRFYAVE